LELPGHGRWIRRAAIAVAASLLSGPAVAQDTVLRGIVTDSAGTPLSYANVQVNAGKRYVADDSRRFRFQARGGRFSLIVRRIGFEPAEVILADRPDTAIRVALRAVPVALKGVIITGGSAFTSLDVRGFYTRMRDAERGINRGYFVTPEDMERRRPNWLTQMVENYPTVKVKRLGNPRGDVIIGSQNCEMTVYLDGVRIVGRLGVTDDLVNEMVVPTHVAGMEIYPRATVAPPQYQSLNGLCGVVLIWTK
jgi:hypothetical protein